MGLGSYTPIAPAGHRGGLGAYQQWPMSFNQFITDVVQVSQGGTTVDKVRAYMVAQINDGLAKLSKYSYQITSVVNDPAVQAALKIEYDKANANTATFKRIAADPAGTITEATQSGVYGGLNAWRGGITHLAQVIEAVPENVGIGVAASQVATQAKTAMLESPEYQELVQTGGAGGGMPDQYWVLLKQQLYAKALAEQMSKILPSDAMAPINAQVENNSEELAQYKNNFSTAIDAVSDAVPAVKEVLDMAENGWGDFMGNLFSKYKWWIIGAAAIVGVYYVAGKAVEGGFSVSAVTANKPSRKFVLEPRR
jgi:hypothetical protein